MTLDQLPLHQTARIVAVAECIKETSLPIFAVIEGSMITHLNTAPLGDPMQVKVEANYLSIDKSLAQKIILEPLV